MSARHWQGRTMAACRLGQFVAAATLTVGRMGLSGLLLGLIVVVEVLEKYRVEGHPIVSQRGSAETSTSGDGASPTSVARTFSGNETAVNNQFGGNADYLTETTRIVTIKVFSPAAKQSNSNRPGVLVPDVFASQRRMKQDGGTVLPEGQASRQQGDNFTTTTSFTISSRNGSNGVELAEAEELLSTFNTLCIDGPPFVENGSPHYCTLNSGCPRGYWCHISSSKAFTYCCPHARVDNGCNLEPSGGLGNGRMERWYFDAKERACRSFLYTGYGGNQNNFLTRQDCIDICGLWLSRVATVHSWKGPGHGSNARSGNTDRLTSFHRSVLDAHQFDPATKKTGVPQALKLSSAFDMISPRDFSPWSIPFVTLPSHSTGIPTSSLAHPPAVQADRRSMESGRARCLDAVGLTLIGRPAITDQLRWYYDYLVDACKPFVRHSGAQETKNNFDTEFECNYYCKGKFPPAQPRQPPIPPKLVETLPPIRPNTIQNMVSTPCYFPPNPGHGYLRLVRWYFHPDDGHCREFFYSGQGGNANNFENEDQCLFACVLMTLKHRGSDPCTMPRATGTGSATLTRFFYDQWTGQCESFIYSGEGGNRNNFFTWEECRLTCTGTIPPPSIPYSRPATPDAIRAQSDKQSLSSAASYFWENGWPEHRVPNTGASTVVSPIKPAPVHPCKGVALPEYVYCTSYNNYQCPVGMYCHIGSNDMETVCCPTRGKSGNVNVCMLPMDTGFGTAVMPRWYFNALSNHCEMFQYKGMKGNPNNFLTHDACVEKCGVNPCGAGSPYKVNGQNVQCSTLEQHVCPESHHCHIGADAESSVCCPRYGNVCTMPIAVGNGKAQLQRWAFSVSTVSCRTFIYTGLGGNENNFLTEADCVGTCQAHLAPLNPCSSGRPARGSNGVELIYCSTSNLSACPPRYYCHIGGSPETTLCCPLSSVSSKPCQLPVRAGSGDTALSRWHFDASSSTCKQFIYSGIGGNENNFLSLADCQLTCQEFDNPCPGGVPLVNPITGQMHHCNAFDSKCASTFWCHIGGDQQASVCCPFAANPCIMPRVEGNGRYQLQRFYFDQDVKQCLLFIYSGLSGNQNNFLSLADCESVCLSHIEDVYAEYA